MWEKDKMTEVQSNDDIIQNRQSETSNKYYTKII